MTATEGRKQAVLAADDRTLAKAATALDEMLTAAKNRVPQNPAKAIIAHNLKVIDELSRNGATLAAIYERLNKAVRLGISPSSFTQYVRELRIAAGSELYKPSGPRQSKSKAEAVASPRHQPEREPVTAAVEEAAAASWNCDKCETDAEPIKGDDGKTYWACRHCETVYESGEDGKISTVRLPM